MLQATIRHPTLKVPDFMLTRIASAGVLVAHSVREVLGEKCE
jgi:hypothetical protein